jgi:hypothetical protein
MQLEFHQLDRRWEHLRVRHAARQRRLLASLVDSGQQTPIVVVAAEGQADRYVVIDGYKRIGALQQLGRDTVEVVVWPMSEAAAVLLDRSLRLSEHETALEVGWLLAEHREAFEPSGRDQPGIEFPLEARFRCRDGLQRFGIDDLVGPLPDPREVRA